MNYFQRFEMVMISKDRKVNIQPSVLVSVGYIDAYIVKSYYFNIIMTRFMRMFFYMAQFSLFSYYYPYLSFIHERANCIAVFWTKYPHSFGSYHFLGVWATCLPRKGGGVPLSALPETTTNELADLLSTAFLKCRTPSREAVDITF